MSRQKISRRSSAATTNVFVEVDGKGQFFLKAQPQFERELRRLTNKVADRARAIVKAEHERTPSHPMSRRPTGRLRRSIQPYKGRAAVVRKVGLDEIATTISAGSVRAKYAAAVHNGARQHIIRAKPGRKLSFIGAGRNGRKTYTRTRMRLLNDEEWAQLELFNGITDEYWYAMRRYNRRKADWKAGRNSWMRRRDADVTVDEIEHKYKDRRVVVDQVNHPGYKGSRFLTRAAHQVVAEEFGGDFFGSARARSHSSHFRGRTFASRR